MPARDLYHNAVVTALRKDGWTITHDPFRLTVGKRDMYVDLGAERILTAERGSDKIAVEVKTFGGPSPLNELHEAVGQYRVYRAVLKRQYPEYRLLLAIPDNRADIFEEPLGEIVLEEEALSLFLFNPESQEIVRWLP
ncbi:element excision factor XisH family protein [Armatimonas sp.]|uniref:element excision factor XisH family protein n=1 Tax=Armatimonas sp. TaxID=1872638 RepID=UPI003751B225